MTLFIIIILAVIFLAPLIGPVIGLIAGLLNMFKGTKENVDVSYYEDCEEDDWEESNRDDGNFWGNSYTNKQQQSGYDPFDNHWESSFDWKDEDTDGYDDRDDGFWNEREFEVCIQLFNYSVNYFQ